MPVSKRSLFIGFYLFLFLLLACVLGNASCSTSAGTTTCSAAGSVSFPATTSDQFQKASPYPATNIVSVTPGNIVASVQVQLQGLVSSTAGGSGCGTADLGIVLQAPTGQLFEFFGGGGACNETFSGLTLTVSDSASTHLPYDGVAPCSPQATGWPAPSGTNLGSFTPTSCPYGAQDGTFPSPGPGVLPTSALAAPTGTATFGSKFAGVDPNGTWSLYLVNQFGQQAAIDDQHSITGWSLIFTLAPATSTSTTTTLSSSANPSFTSGSSSLVTLSATVTPNPGGGTVTFMDGTGVISSCSSVAVSSSHASCTPTFSTQGNHALTATYNPVSGFGPSTSSILNQFVKNHSTVSGSQYCNPGGVSAPGNATPVPDPSVINVGTDTAALSNAVSTVSVDINSVGAEFAGAIRLLLVSPGGQALEFWGSAGDFTSTSGNFVVSDTAAGQFPASGNIVAGTYQPTAYTQGDVFLSGPAPAPQVPASFTLAAPAGNPNSGTFQTVFNSVNGNGDWTLFVDYNGGSGHTLTIGNWCINITQAVGQATTTSVVASPNMSFSGTPVAVTATVHSATTATTGTVTFTENGVQVAGGPASPVAVNGSGVASFSTSSLSEGDHTILATYNDGSHTFASSFGSSLIRVDNAPQPVIVSGNTYAYCNAGTVTIPGPHNASNIGPAYPNPSNLFVTNIPGTLNNATVQLNDYQVATPDIVTTLLVGPKATTQNSLDFFSLAGGAATNPLATLLFSDAAAVSVPQSGPTSGTYKPTSYATSADSYTADSFYTLPATYQYAAPASTSNLGSMWTAYPNQDPNGIWSLYFNQTLHSNGGTMGGWCLNLTENPPVLSITKTHSGSFHLGQTDAQYTITVTNTGPGSTGSAGGMVTVTDNLPAGITATAASGTGWACSTGTTVSCTRNDALASAHSYPAITVTATLAPTTAVGTNSITNTATVSGGGAAQASANDPTTVLQPPDLTVTKTHSGSFALGDTGDTYAITVTNSGSGDTDAVVNVQDTLPTGLTATAMAGGGWTCNFNTQFCSRSDVLTAGQSYPAITLTVNVADNASSTVINSVTVSGGGEVDTSNDTATDSTTVVGPDLTISKSHGGNFNRGDTADGYSITVGNSGLGSSVGTITVTDTLPAGLTAINIAGVGWNCTLATLTCTRGTQLPANSFASAINVAVSVSATAGPSVTNSATVSGGGDTNNSNNTANDPTTINASDLTIAKSHTGNFFQGETGAAYSITVTNSGTGPTTGAVTVTDTLPTGLTGTNLTGPGWNCTLATLICNRSDALAAGNPYPPITLTVSVASNAPASLSNNVTVSGGGESNTANDSASDSTTIGAGPDLTISKAHTGNFNRGDTGDTYTITVSNSGASASSGMVSVTDTLPAGLTATNITGGGWNCTLATLTCTRSDTLNTSSSYPTITLTVNVAASAPTPLINSASVSGGGDVNPSDNMASDPTVVQTADLTISKSHIGNFSQGETGATYTLTVSNLGPGPTSGVVTVNDTLPSGLTAVAFGGTGWNCTLTPLSCNRSDVLGVSSYPSITLTVNVAANAPSGLLNTATVSGGGETNTANNLAADSTTIGTGPDLTISKSHTGNFNRGDIGDTYLITVSNSGGTQSSGTVTVTDSLPAGLTATAISGAGWGCTLGTLTCTRNDGLNSSSSYPSITLTVDVAATASSPLTNSVSVAGGGDVNNGNNSALDPTTVQTADLVISKTHTGNFSQGQTGATYSLTVKNNGPGPTAGMVTVTDTLPLGLTATALSGAGWNCNLGTLTCTMATVLPATSSYPAITLTVNVAANATTPVTNLATVSGGGENNTANDTASDLTTIGGGPDLTITKSHSGAFSRGDIGDTYTIVVSNSGGSSSSGPVTVTDTLPTGLTANTMSGVGWSCISLTCTNTNILSTGSSYQPITLAVNVAANAPASVTNQVSVSGGGDINTSNNSASDVTAIQTADLTISKSHTGNFSQGQTGATYSLTVTNNGPGPTTGMVTVTDTLPAGLSATAMSGSGWNCTLGTLTCTNANVLSATSSYPSITLTVNVASNAPASVTNQASVSGGGETNTANDAASDVTTISAGAAPDLTITKTHTDTFTQGDTGRHYTITVSNSGGSNSSGTVTVTDTLPSGLTATAISGSGWSCSLSSRTCTRSDALGHSSSYPAITLTVSVASNAPSSVTNTAKVSGGNDSNTANNTANDVTAIAGHPPDLTITKTHSGNFTQGQVGASYTLTVRNAGSGPTSGTITVMDALPTGLTATSMSGSGWSCVLGTLTCTRSSALSASSNSSITLKVNVASNAPSSVINIAAVGGGGETNTSNNTASDPTTITPAGGISFSSTGINFGTVTLWGGTSQYLTVTNHGTTTIKFSPRPFLSNIQGATTKDLTYDGGCGDPIGPGKSCKITLSLWPSRVGSVTAVLNVTDNAAGGPHQIPVTATVIAPKANLSTTALDFGTHSVNSTTVKAVTLSNSGVGSLTITGFGFSGSDSADFTQNNNCGSSLSAGSSCTINLTFKPKSKDTRTATLKISDNAQSSTQSISLTGKGN